MQQQTKLCSFKELQRNVHVKYAKKAFSQKKGNASIQILENYKPKNHISHKEYKEKIALQHEKLRRSINNPERYTNYSNYMYERAIISPLARIFNHILNGGQLYERNNKMA